MNPFRAIEAGEQEQRQAALRFPKFRVTIRWRPPYVAIGGENTALIVAGLVYVAILLLMTHQWR